MSSGGALVRSNFSDRIIILQADLLAFQALAWDPSKAEFVVLPVSSLAGGPRVQRSIIASPIIVGAIDQILNCNIPVPANCILPPFASRAGVAITFKDVGGQAQSNNITIFPNGAETIDGANQPVVLKNNFGWLTLVPFNDAVNSGWSIE